MRSISGIFVAAATLAFTFAGCAPPCPETAISRGQLLDEYNANAAAIPRLRARVALEVSYPDENGMTVHIGSTLLAPENLLAVRKSPGAKLVGNTLSGPCEFCLQMRHSSQEVGRIGISTADNVYYFWTKFGDHRMGFYGSNELAGAPGARELPINPAQLLAVLGVEELPDGFELPRMVLLTMNDVPGQCAYVLTYVAQQPVTGYMLPRREIYFNWDSDANKPRRPYMIKFFDTQGRRVMTATLKNYQPVTQADVEKPADPPPVMPTDIEIDWPQRRSHLHLVLSEMTTADVVSPRFFLFHERLAAAGMTGAVQNIDPPPPGAGEGK